MSILRKTIREYTKKLKVENFMGIRHQIIKLRNKVLENHFPSNKLSECSSNFGEIKFMPYYGNTSVFDKKYAIIKFGKNKWSFFNHSEDDFWWKINLKYIANCYPLFGCKNDVERFLEKRAN